MTTTKKQSKLELVNEIFKPNPEGISEWITREVLESTPLRLTNNGNTRQGVLYGVKYYKWEFERSKNNKITKIRTIGINENINNTSRPIRKDIRDYYSKSPCVVCGSMSSLRVDHKNDLYNDPRVLSSKTQTLEDFQSLCNSCNLKKREVSNKTKSSGKRYKASNIPMLKHLGIDFIEGDELFDMNDPNAMVGTYWYDPIKFIEVCVNRLKST